jgi:Ala-tRNA(Pro) deacylase
MNGTVFERIQGLLDEQRRTYKVVDHVATHTSAESAAARGEPLEIGGKALLVKADDAFLLVVLRADQKLDSRALQRAVVARKLRFASRDELAALTGGLVPGSMPPFGRPLFDFALYVDEALTRNDRIAFNAGMLTRSIVMPMADYLVTANPIVASFAA